MIKKSWQNFLNNNHDVGIRFENIVKLENIQGLKGLQKLNITSFGNVNQRYLIQRYLIQLAICQVLNRFPVYNNAG